MKRNILLFVLPVILLITSCTSKEKKSENYMKDGIDKIESSDNKGALTDFSKVIEMQPGNAEAYYYRANAYFNLRKTKEAIADYTKAIELKPDYADAYFNRALCKQFLNDKTGACSDWKKAAAYGKPNVNDKLKECN
jgi:tetratricopeptide (TPR) repeat protein